MEESKPVNNEVVQSQKNQRIDRNSIVALRQLMMVFGKTNTSVDEKHQLGVNSLQELVVQYRRDLVLKYKKKPDSSVSKFLKEDLDIKDVSNGISNIPFFQRILDFKKREPKKFFPKNTCGPSITQPIAKPNTLCKLNGTGLKRIELVTNIGRTVDGTKEPRLLKIFNFANWDQLKRNDQQLVLFITDPEKNLRFSHVFTNRSLVDLKNWIVKRFDYKENPYRILVYNIPLRDNLIRRFRNRLQFECEWIYEIANGTRVRSIRLTLTGDISLKKKPKMTNMNTNE